MSAQQGVDNIYSQQGVASSIDPNYLGDQLQLIVNQLDDTNKPLVVTNGDGTRIGEIFQDDTYGLVLQAFDDADSPLPVTLAGSSVLLAGDNLLVTFNGAEVGDFVRVESEVTIDGKKALILGAVPLEVTQYSQSFFDSDNHTITTSFTTVLTGTVASTYSADTSYAKYLFRATNSSNQARTLEFGVTLNGADPTGEDIFTAVVPAKSQGNNGVALIGGNDTSTTLVSAGENITLRVRSTSGTGVTLTGSALPTEVTMTQNADITATINSNSASSSAIVKALNTRVAIGNTLADGTGVPNPSGLIDVVCLGNGGDELLTPPINPQPETGGDYKGYVKVPLVELVADGDITIVNNEIVFGSGAEGDYFATQAYMNMGSSANANNVGLVFGLHIGTDIYFSQRVVSTRMANGADVTNLVGGGFLDNILTGYKLSVWICSEKPATIEVHDCNLGMQMRVPKELKI